ncbi:MAG: epoxyqueuosine reductase QueH [Candidatus Zixiibacteriota bacterium]
MNILVHICCGPCAVHPFEKLIDEGHRVAGYWYNPNIHPYREYKERLESLKKLESLTRFEMIYFDSYDLEKYLESVMPDLDRRCMHCYDLRLMQTATYAEENGFDAFSSTLLVSPYQDQDWIREVGAAVQEKTGVKFLDIDFTPGFRDGKQKAYDMGLYIQKYCGCIFSERERYEKKKP